MRVAFNFDLIFDLLRTGEGDKELGEPFGIKFDKLDKTFTLKCHKSEKELLEWRDFLERRINERGFHELFKPIKKIGKGNFASVYLVVKH
jgi:hypothetical protein